jgi:transposase InsO family protein
MAGFYSGADSTTPPLHWPTFKRDYVRVHPLPDAKTAPEAFVKTFKRDYVRVHPLPDAKTALSLIAGWIKDDNEVHPHSGLRMRSQREFRRAPS